jgi:hypothetical protein
MGLWAKSVQIFNSIRENGTQSIRCLARHLGLSKSSVHRHLRRSIAEPATPSRGYGKHQKAETGSSAWVVATLFIFGLKRGVGAETISEFFARLHLETHIGCSPSALRSVMHTLEQTILETIVAWEQEGIAHGEIRPIIEVVDETFLPRMMLVFMELASGYLLMEEVTVERTYDTWDGLVKARLKTLEVGVLYLVSDRAKALIKLAQTGVDCLSISDLFHLSYDLAKSSSLAVFSRLRHAQQALTHAQQRLATLQASHPGSAQTQQTQALVEASEAEVQRWQGVGSAYRHGLGNLSLIMHPWRLVDSTRQTSRDVERQLQAEVEALEALMETHGVLVKKNALAKIRKQLAGVSALVDLWWPTVWHDVEHIALSPRWKHWVEALLLPLMYWQEQRSHTPCPRQKAALLQALRTVQGTFERHSCTQRLAHEILADWQAWALSMRGPSSRRPRQLKVATGICRRCSIIIVACQNAATRCGRCYTPSIVVPRTGQRLPCAFSGGSFQTFLRRCCQRSMTCHGLGNAIRPSR